MHDWVPSTATFLPRLCASHPHSSYCTLFTPSISENRDPLQVAGNALAWWTIFRFCCWAKEVGVSLFVVEQKESSVLAALFAGTCWLKKKRKPLVDFFGETQGTKNRTGWLQNTTVFGAFTFLTWKSNPPQRDFLNHLLAGSVIFFRIPSKLLSPKYRVFLFYLNLFKFLLLIQKPSASAPCQTIQSYQIALSLWSDGL